MKDLVGQTLGQYRIEAQLGYGGMGWVFRGKHIYLDRPAAIKVMHEHMAIHAEFRARFLQEARLIEVLRHPHIVEIYEFGEQDGLLYLVMELLTAGPLTALIRQYASRQPEPQQLVVGLDLVRQAAEGLAAAHALGVIHRDIKPDNLLLSRLSGSEQGGEQYQLKISDFGLARLSESSGLTVGGPVGTPAYMSPEQCMNGKLDGRSDLYSLGIVLYEVVMGTLPFQITNFNEAVEKHVNVLPPPLQLMRPDLPPIVGQIILRCLAKRPGERYQTGKELAEALQQAINYTNSRTETTPVVPAPSSFPSSQAPRIRVSDCDGRTISVASMTHQGLLIGSQNDCDLVLSAEAVSRHHLQVNWDDHQPMLTDLGSSYGTWLGHEQLVPQVSRVWEVPQAVSIGPFLLHLETSSEPDVPFVEGGDVPALLRPADTQRNQPPQSPPLQEKTHHFWPGEMRPFPFQLRLPGIRSSRQTKNAELLNKVLILDRFILAAPLLAMALVLVFVLVLLIPQRSVPSPPPPISRVVPTATPTPAPTATPTPVPLPQGPNFSSFTDANKSSMQCNSPATIGSSVLELTPAEQYKAGSAYFNQPIDPTQSFQTQFQFSLHDGSSPPADGFAFVMQNSSEGDQAIGTDGQAFGYRGGDISPSVAVIFNMYPNQIRVERNDSTLATSTNQTPTLYGNRLNVWIDYDVPSQRLRVYVDPGNTKPSTPLLTASVNLAALGKSAFVGFTGGTGLYTAAQDILSWRFSGGGFQ